MRAEIIAIGDELTCGHRLDTNSQWISQQLCDLGVTIAFHTTVGDDIDDNLDVFKTAVRRAEIVICTGGLGPTADDLTRQAVSQMAGVELVFDPETLQHIRKIFGRHGREMPEQNNVQAYFPQGSQIVPNPEGTAPGFDLSVAMPDQRTSRIWALPGVPYEMKEMWNQTVSQAISEFTGKDQTICHHVLHCFGGGESQIESMLPDLMRRDRIPRVGITASSATISLRVTAEADSQEDCLIQMQPTLLTIRECLGDLVFGENGQTLQEVVLSQLQQRSLKLSVVDFCFGGSVAYLLNQAEGSDQRLAGSLQMPAEYGEIWLGQASTEGWLAQSAERVRDQFESEIGVAVGPIYERSVEAGESSSVFDLVICHERQSALFTFNFGGHSKIRLARSQKQILNQIRLCLKDM